MVGYPAIGVSSAWLAVPTLSPGPMQQRSLKGRSNALAGLAGIPATFGAGHKQQRDGKRRLRTRLARVACRTTRAAGLGDEHNKEKPQFTSDDWQYLGKLFAGCAAGAGLIKYGCILVPQITEPSLSLALLTVSTTIVGSVTVLSAASFRGPPSDS